MGVKVKFRAGAWWLSVHHGGRRKSKRMGDRETAVRVAQQVRERLAQGDLCLEKEAAPVETLNAYAAGWLKSVTVTLKASTVRFYTGNMDRYILPLLGDRPVGSLTRTDCRQLIANVRSKGLKVNTVRGVARTLSAVLSNSSRTNSSRRTLHCALADICAAATKRRR